MKQALPIPALPLWGCVPLNLMLSLSGSQSPIYKRAGGLQELMHKTQPEEGPQEQEPWASRQKCLQHLRGAKAFRKLQQNQAAAQPLPPRQLP